MKIRFLDLGATYDELKTEIDAAISRVLSSGWYILGPEVEEFENEFASYCDTDYCVGVGNGLDALQLALRALDVEPGDEVIVPSNTFIATWLAVSQCGAIPVPVEPLESTYNIDPGGIEAVITPRTKVILAVHLYGQPADLDAIKSIADQYGIAVLEDAAQSHGATYKDRRIGGHGDAVAWSFYPGKNLGAFGDGGAVTTDNDQIASRIQILRNYGASEKYKNDIRGFNSRLDPIQAAVLRVKLKHLDLWNTRRVAIARRYTDGLSDLKVGLPKVEDWAGAVWHLYVLRCANRDSVRSELSEMGIETLVHYPVPPHRQMAYDDMGFEDSNFPLTAKIAGELISLPIGPHISSSQADRVVESVRSILLRA